MRKNFRSNKRAQITIFIILALLLVVGIIFIFLLRQTPKTEVVSEENPQAFIESCTRQAVEEALDLIMIHSGSLESRGSVLYEGQNISYLCYTNINYRSCVNQQPLLIEHIEDEIYTYIKPRVANCFQTLEATLEPGYEVEMEEDWDLTPRLTSHGVEVEINRDFKMQRGTNIRSFNLFKISIIHPIYRLAEIAVEIVNQEAKYCNFDTLGFMIIYPKYDIKKFRTGNSDTIYSLKEIKTDKS
ncbi:MAG: hypothetical protein WCX73_03675, partial [Candidatus Pacearchaeota archaeon]